METPSAVSVTFFALFANPKESLFILGSKEQCLKEAIKEPIRNVYNGKLFFDKFCAIVRSYITFVENGECENSSYETARNSFMEFARNRFAQTPARVLEKVGT